MEFPPAIQGEMTLGIPLGSQGGTFGGIRDKVGMNGLPIDVIDMLIFPFVCLDVHPRGQPAGSQDPDLFHHSFHVYRKSK